MLIYRGHNIPPQAMGEKHKKNCFITIWQQTSLPSKFTRNCLSDFIGQLTFTLLLESRASWQSIALWKYSCCSLEMSGVYLLWLTGMVYILYLYEWGNNMLQIFSVFDTRNDRGTNHRPVDRFDECKSFSILLDWWTTNEFHQLGTTGCKWTLFYNIKHIKLYSCM